MTRMQVGGGRLTLRTQSLSRMKRKKAGLLEITVENKVKVNHTHREFKRLFLLLLNVNCFACRPRPAERASAAQADRTGYAEGIGGTKSSHCRTCSMGGEASDSGSCCC